ncbi:MAG: ATP-binding protein, partial [Mediterranea sp.]|nr:ATP-binding protein [Mediterranea sp.]
DFEKLRKDGCVYVDKTEYIYQLARTSSPYFLGRPRRFGKSLLLSTMKAYFLGKRELFGGLAIERLETEWEEYPVFHLDMNRGIYTSLDTFMSALNANLKALEGRWGKDESEDTPANRLNGLIERACQQGGKRVVVLIDEYDKPLLDTMDNPELHALIRPQLQAFYSVLKSADPYLRFLFFTGVTKFGQAGVFSGMNQPRDISMSRQYMGICGITETELVANFQPELHALAEMERTTYEDTLAKMRRMYDGYHFLENTEGVYNPFSVLNTFADLKYAYYWSHTGTPTFLVKLIKAKGVKVPSLENDISASQDAFTDYRAGDDNLIPFMYQSGYLTIRDYNPAIGLYTLGFPNEEVRVAFLKALLPLYLPQGNDQQFESKLFLQDLYRGEVDAFMTRLQAFLADIPYGQEEKSENYYQTALYMLFTLIGECSRMERQTAKGRADLVVEIAGTVYVFEFKMIGYGTAADALRQIDEKGYLIPYNASGKRLVKIGAAFSKETRTLGEWLIG